MLMNNNQNGSFKPGGYYGRKMRRNAGRGSYDYTGNWNPFKAASKALGMFNTADMQLRNNLRVGLMKGMVSAEAAKMKTAAQGEASVDFWENLNKAHSGIQENDPRMGPITSATPGGKVTTSGQANIIAAEEKNKRLKDKAKDRADEPKPGTSQSGTGTPPPDTSKRKDSTVAQDLGTTDEDGVYSVTVKTPAPQAGGGTPRPVRNFPTFTPTEAEAPKTDTEGKVGKAGGDAPLGPMVPMGPIDPLHEEDDKVVNKKNKAAARPDDEA
jgi:hypothetical protein